MPNVSLTLKFLDAANQPRNWTDVDQAAIGALNLTGLNSGNTAQFSGTINVSAPSVSTIVRSWDLCAPPIRRGRFVKGWKICERRLAWRLSASTG